MNQLLNKKYFIASILIHIFIVVVISFMMKRDSLSNKNFVIFGAHSRLATKAIYKSGTITPFTGSRGATGTKKNARTKSKPRAKKKQPVVKKAMSPKKVAPKVAAKKTAANKTVPAARSLQKSSAAVMPAATAMLDHEIKASKTPKKLKKKELPKPVVQQAVVDEPIVAENIVDEKKEIQLEKELTPEQQQEAVQLADNSDAEDFDDDEEPIHVGIVDATDPVTRYHQRVIGQEFNRLWQPPLGVRKGTECSVKIVIGKTNNIASIDFIKRSGIPIYDLSILRLKLAKFEVPQSLHGKHLIVVFHQ